MCVFLNWKLHDVVAHIDKYVSCLLKNANTLQFFFYILDFGFCVSKVIYFYPFCFVVSVKKIFPLLLDIVSIVAKTIKIWVRIPYSKSIVPHKK